MTDLTDEAVTIGLDDERIKFFADRLLEVARINAAAESCDGESDKEDLASYAGEVVALRRALLAARAIINGKTFTVDEAQEAIAQARADTEAAHERGMDEAADKILDWLAKAVGAKEYTACDGSETWDGDVQGTVYAILKAGNVYDDEDGRVAKLADAEAAVALVVETIQDEVQKLRRQAGQDADGVRFQALDDVRHLIRQLDLASASTLAKLAELRERAEKAGGV